MSRRFVLETSLSVVVLLSPALLLAQHAGGSAVGHVQMAAPAHMGSMSVQQGMHPPVHASQPSRLSSSMRSATTVAHTTLAHSTSRPASSKSTAQTYRPRTLRNDLYGDPYSNAYPAPGLGFDYVHYAAVHPSYGHSHDHFRGGAIFPVFGGSYYDPGTDDVDSAAPDQRPAEQNQNGTDVQPSQSADAERQEEAPVSPPWARPVPVPPSSEYIFVRRDGSVFFAVAYSWVNGDLQYITKDGFRKLASGTTLDLDATTQFNEQRGVSFHSPA